MKNEYLITMPFAGTISTTIEAESEEQAKELFHEKLNKINNFLDDKEMNENGFQIDECDIYEKIVEGNVCYVWQQKMSIDKI